MATIYKRTRRKPIPQGAEIIQRDGKRFAVWLDRGRRRRAPLADDGAAILDESSDYTIEYFNHRGRAGGWAAARPIRTRHNGSPISWRPRRWDAGAAWSIHPEQFGQEGRRPWWTTLRTSDLVGGKRRYPSARF